MKPKQELVNDAVQDGTMDKVNQLLSAAHLLICVSNNFIEEASEHIQKKGLLLGPIKMNHNMYSKQADKYFSSFASLITTDKSKMNMFGDMEVVEKMIREWAKIK